MKKQLLSSALILLATQTVASTPATVAYVDAEDDQIIIEIENKGGSVGELDCQKNNPPPSSNATVAYVDACDDELNAAINSIPGGSRYTVGDLVCGTDAHTCTGSETPWGIVIYADPNPQESGHGGLAMALVDQVNNGTSGCSGSSCAPWSSAALTSALIGANKYGIYGGINANTGSAAGNTKKYCSTTNSDCNIPSSESTTSAFNACTQYNGGGHNDWYLPATAELMLMFSVAQQLAYGADATSPYTHTEPQFFVNFTRNAYWSSTENNGFGTTCFPGNCGGTSAASALYLVFATGVQDADSKNTQYAVRCARALPI